MLVFPKFAYAILSMSGFLIHLHHSYVPITTPHYKGFVLIFDITSSL